MISSWVIVGGLLALAAFVVSYLGIRNPDFPSGDRGEKVVSAVFIVLVAGAIASGILSSSHEYEERTKAKAAAPR